MKLPVCVTYRFPLIIVFSYNVGCRTYRTLNLGTCLIYKIYSAIVAIYGMDFFLAYNIYQNFQLKYKKNI